ncbi:MAG: AAA family ATPase [Acidimicrobiia bacterium]
MSSSRSFAGMFDSIVDNVGIVLRGKRPVIELAVVGLLSDGHLLIEDVPGVGKTSLAKALAASIDCAWQRVQFTPDLLPADVVGASMWSREREQFDFLPGPIFTNIVLADESNRASPKTQSALLEAMEERQVTVDGASRPLPRPFFVIATQNPVEHEGTYQLPESQLDRFLMRISIGYPDRRSEFDITDPNPPGDTKISSVVGSDEVAMMIEATERVRMVDAVREYIVDIAHASRRHSGLALGLSPRATVQLARATRALAASRGRDYATPDDVKELAPATLAHRVMVRHDAAARGLSAGDAINEIVASVAAPSGR